MLIPISDDNTGRLSTPFIVYLLIAVNVLVFFIELSGGQEFIAAYSVIPYEISHGIELVTTGPLRRGDIPQAQGPSPIYLTLLTSMFMHGGFMHIAGNMLYLWIFGDNVEDDFGHVKFVVFYLVCGIAASISQIAIDPNSTIPSLGASGAIAGVLGAYLIMFPRNRVRCILPLGFIWTTIELPAVAVLGFWIILQVISQYTAFSHTAKRSGGVAYMAHIGGFVAGIILTFLFRSRRPPRFRPVSYYEDD